MSGLLVGVIDLDEDDYEDEAGSHPESNEGVELKAIPDAKRQRATDLKGKKYTRPTPLTDHLLYYYLNLRVTERKSLSKEALAGNSRTIYLGGLPAGLEHFQVHRQIFDQIKGAPVEALRILPAKQCAFIDFFDEESALKFVEKFEKSGRKFLVREKEVKVAWAQSTKFSASVQTAIINGATRNIYLSGIEIDNPDDEKNIEAKMAELNSLFGQFGDVDMVKVVPEKKIAFVHMSSVASAMQAVDVLSAKPEWKGKKINFGSDRCGERPPPGVHPTMLAAKRKLVPEQEIFDELDEPVERIPYRTIYIGGLTQDIAIEDLCEVIRGGLIQSIRMASQEKHCAFVTFVDEPSAVTFHDFFTHYQPGGFMVKGKPLKLGWSKPSHTPAAVTQALRKGATRNIYIGNIDVASLGPDPRSALLEQCSKHFGPVETVNLVPSKNIVFVAFCNLLDAVKALAGLRELPEYSNCKLAYGKDRCAQPLKVNFPPPTSPYGYYPANPVPYPHLTHSYSYHPPYYQSYPPPPPPPFYPANNPIYPTTVPYNYPPYPPLPPPTPYTNVIPPFDVEEDSIENLMPNSLSLHDN